MVSRNKPVVGARNIKKGEMLGTLLEFGFTFSLMMGQNVILHLMGLAKFKR